MSRLVNIDLEKFILMERKNMSERTPCALLYAEFDKFRHLIEAHGDYYKIPDTEEIEVFPMFRNDKGEFVVVDHLKKKERANLIDSTWVWVS